MPGRSLDAGFGTSSRVCWRRCRARTAGRSRNMPVTRGRAACRNHRSGELGRRCGACRCARLRRYPARTPRRRVAARRDRRSEERHSDRRHAASVLRAPPGRSRTASSRCTCPMPHRWVTRWSTLPSTCPDPGPKTPSDVRRLASPTASSSPRNRSSQARRSAFEAPSPSEQIAARMSGMPHLCSMTRLCRFADHDGH